MIPDPKKIEAVLEQLDRHELTARAAMDQLVTLGLTEAIARDAVFTLLGGSSIVNGDRYEPSGRLVSDVEADMQK